MTDDDRIAQAKLDMAEVEAQLAAGELDRETADRLTATYQAEIDGLSVDTHQQDQADGAPAGGGTTRSWNRALWGTVIVALAVGAILAAVVQAVTERDGGFITGAAAEGTGVDLDSISNETMAEVIAANPDNPQINQMRLALAGRYFDEGDQQEAFQWYDAVLQNNPTNVEASEALGRIGLLVHASGDSDLAEQTLLRALDLAPDNVDARFFLGRVYADLERTEDARREWALIATDSDLPQDIRDIAQEAIDQLGAG